MSLGTSAETQLVSSGVSSSAAPARAIVSVVVVEAYSDLMRRESESSRCLRFLGLSPLNVSGFTISDGWFAVGGKAGRLNVKKLIAGGEDLKLKHSS